MRNKHVDVDPKHFVPRGAIAFFILLLLLTAIIWFNIYDIQLDRANF